MPPPPAGAQLSGLGLLLGLKPAESPPPAPSPLALLPPPPIALSFPALPALFSSRRSDGRRQGILIGGSGDMDVRRSLAAFRAKLQQYSSDDDDDDDDDSEEESSEEEEEKRQPKPKKQPKRPNPRPKKPAASAAPASPAASPASPPPAPAPVQRAKVKVQSRGAKALPAASLAGMSAQHQEEKTNNAVSPRSGQRVIGRAGGVRAGGANVARIGASGGSGGVLDSSMASVPANLPRNAPLLHFFPVHSLRSPSPADLARIFEHYSSDSSAASGGAGGGGACDRSMRKDDLFRLAGDALARLRRVLADELAAQGMGPKDVANTVERELGFVVKGKSEEERKTYIVASIVSRAGTKSASVPKNAFMQHWGSLSAELFTVRTDGALGCVIS